MCSRTDHPPYEDTPLTEVELSESGAPTHLTLTPDMSTCIAIAANKTEAKQWLWNLATYGVPTRLSKGPGKTWHIAVATVMHTFPVVWLASFRDDPNPCTNPTTTNRHPTHPEPWTDD